MKRPVVSTLILLGFLLAPLAASAVEIRAFVADFAVSSPESADLKATLKRLLISRLPGEGLGSAETAAQADVIVSASYTQLGKVFSLDASAKTAAGKPLASAFEQGDGLDALIPALGKLSLKLRDEILKGYPQGAAHTEAASKAPKVDPIIEKATPAEIVHQDTGSSWLSQRIEGVKRSLAPGASKELFIVDGNTLYLYRRDSTLALIAQTELPSRYRVLAVDSVCADPKGTVLAFVSIMDGDAPASRVYAVANGSLQLQAENLQYLFRALGQDGGTARLYAQEVGRSDDYYGDVHEASFSEGSIKLGKPVKMPRYANIFNFNTFRDQAGKSYVAAFSDGGHLIVYSDKGEELWRSDDKFGGSETNFQRSDHENERFTGSQFRTRFIDQRITVTERGEIIVPQNSGFFVVGNSRSYSKYSIFAFAWNGSSLEERWRTKQSQNYLADYSYLPDSKELLLLEIVQKEGLLGKGASAVKMIRAE